MNLLTPVLADVIGPNRHWPSAGTLLVTALNANYWNVLLTRQYHQLNCVIQSRLRLPWS